MLKTAGQVNVELCKASFRHTSSALPDLRCLKRCSKEGISAGIVSSVVINKLSHVQWLNIYNKSSREIFHGTWPRCYLKISEKRLEAPGSIAIFLDRRKIQKKSFLKYLAETKNLQKFNIFCVVSFVCLLPKLTTSFGWVRFYRWLWLFWLIFWSFLNHKLSKSKCLNQVPMKRTKADLIRKSLFPNPIMSAMWSV